MTDTPTSRRGFFGALSIGLAGFWALVSAALAGMAVLGPLGRARASQEIALGPATGFGSEFQRVQINVPSSHGWQARDVLKTIYVRALDDGSWRALSAECTHLGCTVRWADDAQEFQCPCHGGTFDAHGERTAGPPPRGLDTLEAEVRDGQLFVRLS